MSKYVTEVNVYGQAFFRMEDGNTVTINIGSPQQSINALTLSDNDLDFVDDLLGLISTYAKQARNRQQAHKETEHV